MRRSVCILGPAVGMAPAGAAAGQTPPMSVQAPLAAPGAPPADGSVASPVPPDAELPPPPVLTDEEARAEADRIRRDLRDEVPHVITASPSRQALLVSLARGELAASGRTIDRPQLLVVVDRAPSVQMLQLVAAFPDAPWRVLGGTRVSTGQSGRKLYYITPTGVFENTDAILGYRAQGTFNEHHIRGNGLKGMRVWDFGWHEAVKGWLPTPHTVKITLDDHSNKPQFLEARIGRPASEGCVRIPAAMNRFLDLHGVLDVDYERAASLDVRFRALLLPNRHPTRLAGKMLVVVDTAGQRA